MAFNYTASRATAKRLLTSFGQSVTITGTSAEVFDPATGGYTGGGTVTITGVGARTKFKTMEIDGEAVQKGDVKLVFEGGAGVPLVGYTATLDGVVYRVMDAMPLVPAGTVVIYTLQLRA